jgi:hypothetical protein
MQLFLDVYNVLTPIKMLHRLTKLHFLDAIKDMGSSIEVVHGGGSMETW